MNGALVIKTTAGLLNGVPLPGEACAPLGLASGEARHQRGSSSMATRKNTPSSRQAQRFHGEELRRAVLEAADAEIERRRQRIGDPLPFERPSGGWRQWARSHMAPSPAPFLAASRQFHELRAAIIAAIDAARSDARVWEGLVDENPALAELSFEAWGGAHEVVSDGTAATIKWRLEKLKFAGDWGPGPSWRLREAPKKRDLALLLILSGYVSPRWPMTKATEMTVAEAVTCVVDAVRQYYTQHSVADDDSEVRH